MAEDKDAPSDESEGSTADSGGIRDTPTEAEPQTDDESAAEGDNGGEKEGTESPAETIPADRLKDSVLAEVQTYFQERFDAEETPESESGKSVADSRSGATTSDGRAPKGATETSSSGGITDRIQGLFGTRRDEQPAEMPPSQEFLEERWFDFSFLEEYEVADHYWVRRPFAHVTILYDASEKRYAYHVSEPVLNGFEDHLRGTLVQVLRSGLMYEDVEMAGERSAVFADRLRDVVNDYAATVAPGTVHKLLYYLVRDFLDYGEIDPLMRDDHLEDISCDGAKIPVYVFHDAYRDLRTNVTFDQRRLNSLTIRLAQLANKQISVSDPLVDGTLPDGSRIQLTLGGDIANRGSNFTIRNFSDIPLTPIDLIQFGTFNVEQMAYFWLAIENGKSLMFAGGTGSGKTTSMNAVSFFIPPDSKVVSIEDTLEITLPHENWVQSTTRKSASATGQGEVGMYELLQAALRQRPEYILVGEVRTDPNVALTFFQAIGTGHTAYTTFHSDSVEGALSRLANPPLEIPVQMLRELDIISIQKQVYLGRDRARRNAAVAELGASDDQTSIDPLLVFERDAAADRFEQVADSQVLTEVARERGWDDDQLEEELEARRRVLSYLIDHDITAYPDVAATIHTYARDPEFVLDRIDREELSPSELPGEL